jgi:hypothetical protein
MKTQLLIILLLALGLLTACAKYDPHSMDVTQALHNPKTKADHEALAQHYEAVAQEMQNKAEEHKEILSHYEREPWLMGKRATDIKSHCKNLIQIYSRAMEENLEMAKVHRQVAQ